MTTFKHKENGLIAVIGDEDTVTGFLLAGVGEIDARRQSNFLVVTKNTPIPAIEDAFRKFTNREDVAIVLINQHVANEIRFLLDGYHRPIPSVLEIPSKEHPYDPAKDSILRRAKTLFQND
eukprot:Opistho-1_new@10922